MKSSTNETSTTFPAPLFGDVLHISLSDDSPQKDCHKPVSLPDAKPTAGFTHIRVKHITYLLTP
jgi:hypothetical protein